MTKKSTAAFLYKSHPALAQEHPDAAHPSEHHHSKGELWRSLTLSISLQKEVDENSKWEDR